MGAPLTYEQGLLCLRLQPSGWFVRLALEDRGRRGIGHFAPAVLKEAHPKHGVVRPVGHRRDEKIPWFRIHDWVARNKTPAPEAPKAPLPKTPEPAPPILPDPPEKLAPVRIPDPPPVPSPLAPPTPEPTMSTPPPTSPPPNRLNGRLLRLAGDALLELAKDPAFQTMTRPTIAEHLTAKLNCPIAPNNVKTIAESIDLTLPSNRGPSSASSISEIRLTRAEDAITFLLRNAHRMLPQDVLPQLDVVRASWLTHLSTHRQES